MAGRDGEIVVRVSIPASHRQGHSGVSFARLWQECAVTDEASSGVFESKVKSTLLLFSIQIVLCDVKPSFQRPRIQVDRELP